VSAPEAALLVAFIGLSGVLITNVLTTRAMKRNAFVQELRSRTAEVFKQAFVLQHAMEWVTWHAAYEPDALTEKLKQDYATEVHQAFPALQGAMTAAAALSMDVYREMQPILEEVYKLEFDVALALRFVGTEKSAHAKAVTELSALAEPAMSLHTSLPERLGEIMALAVSQRP
jgi:hypothetical protein